VAPFELHGSLQCGTAQRQGAMRADSWRNVRFNCLVRTAQHGVGASKVCGSSHGCQGAWTPCVQPELPATALLSVLASTSAALSCSLI
jgi:hypothetical protein